MISLPQFHRALLLLALLSSSPFCPASDWPQWRGPHGTGHAPAGSPVPQKLPADLKPVWKINAGEGLASPVVAEGRAFLFDAIDGQETLRALDASSGQELWRKTVDAAFRDSQGPAGPRCTPLVDEDRVYALSCKGELQCLSTRDGSLIWRASFTNDFSAVFIGEKGNIPGAARHGNNGSPLIVGDRLIAQVGGVRGESVVCFDKRSGQVLWKSQNDQAAYAPPVHAEIAGAPQIISFTVDGLIGLNPGDGALLWRVPFKTAFGRHVTTPVVWRDRVIVASHQFGLASVQILSQENRFSASEAWIQKDSAMNFSSPVRAGDFLYGLGPQKNLICVDLLTGKQTWSKPGYIQTSADKAHAAFLVLGENLLVLTDGGELVLLQANPEDGKELGRAQVCGLNWCNPAFANGKLFVRDGIKTTGSLYCYDLLP